MGWLLGGFVLVMVDCLVWCFPGGGGGQGFNGGGSVSVVTLRYDESTYILRAVAVVSISPGSQRGASGRGVCLLWCD